MSESKSKRAPKTHQSSGSPKPSQHSQNKDFRENPDRSVCVFGEINASLVRQLTPHILKLRRDSCSEPITVYIDSPGGVIQSYEYLEGLLFNENQDGNKCRIITVATSFAASAAARLLARGDYSMAYKNATIHCHGARLEGGTITKERAESMVESLALFNEDMSSDFAHKIIESLTWLYRFNYDSLDKKDGGLQAYRPIYELSKLVRTKLHGPTRRLLDDALIELQNFSGLEAFLQNKQRSAQLAKASKLGQGHRDLRLLKLITDYLSTLLTDDEKKNGLPKRTLSELTALYSLRRSYYERFIADCDNPEPLLMMFCEKDQLEQVAKLGDPAIRRDFLISQCGTYLFAAWQLAIALSAGLVKGENSLSASDAYWLGIIDEVVGDHELYSKRQFQES